MTGNMYRDIIITGSVGESGALRIAGENRDKIRKRFPGHMIKEIEKKYESNVGENRTTLLSDRSRICLKMTGFI